VEGGALGLPEKGVQVGEVSPVEAADVEIVAALDAEEPRRGRNEELPLRRAREHPGIEACRPGGDSKRHRAVQVALGRSREGVVVVDV
jgi:hypothetical protein